MALPGKLNDAPVLQQHREIQDMYDFGLVMMLGCALLYYRIGDREYGRGILLGALSILVWVLTHYGLHWRWISSLGAQAGIFGSLTILNCFRKPSD